MKKNIYISPGTTNLNIRAQLAKSSMEVAGALLVFDREISSPIDRSCESLVYQGCAQSFELSLCLLNKPNSLAKSVLTQLESADQKCQELYEENSLKDDYDRDHRRFAPYPAWNVLSAVGRLPIDECQAERCAIGVNIGLAFASKKKIARGYMERIDKSLEKTQLTIEDLKHLLALPQLEQEKYTKSIPWFKQFALFLTEFKQTFDELPDARPPIKSFDQKVRDEMCYRAVFTSAHHRAGILDNQCLSKRQIALAISYDSPSPFSSMAARRVATWLIEFSGLNVQTISSIRIETGSPLELIEDWAIKFELASGILFRDYTILATDSADPEGIDAEPASFICPLPSPKRIHEDVKELLCQVRDDGGPLTFGKLIPELDTLQPQWPIYPSVDQLTPSWAKLTFTVGPYLVNKGMDSMLAGALVGTLGIPIKSKLFYSRLTPAEIWLAAAHAYQIMGHSSPVEMPPGLLAFGASVVSSNKTLMAVDTANLSEIDSQREKLIYVNNGNRLSTLLNFHKVYTIAIGYRLMVRLSLRAAAKFPLRASILGSNQLTLDFREKASAGRSGGVAAIITADMRNELLVYQKHCEALHSRLLKLGFTGVAMQWLKDVCNSQDVDLLSLIAMDGAISQVSTKQIVDAALTTAALARDFGRKWMENALRTTGYQPIPGSNLPDIVEFDGVSHGSPELPAICTGCRTEDVDQSARHEATGRETTTAISDSCERTWARRMGPVIDRASKGIFMGSLQGLRKK